MLSLNLPILPAGINLNSRMHWSVKAKLTKKARTIAYLKTSAWLKSNEVIKPNYKVEVQVVFPNRRRRDIENVSVKPYLDGIFDAFKEQTGNAYLYDDSRITKISNQLLGIDPNKKGYLILNICHID